MCAQESLLLCICWRCIGSASIRCSFHVATCALNRLDLRTPGSGRVHKRVQSPLCLIFRCCSCYRDAHHHARYLVRPTVRPLSLDASIWLFVAMEGTALANTRKIVLVRLHPAMGGVSVLPNCARDDTSQNPNVSEAFTASGGLQK